jgi:hypothetical protein
MNGKRFTLCASALVAAVVASPAVAVDSSKTMMIAAPADKVWSVIGDFCGIGDWHPAVETCELSETGGKTIRTLSLKGGGSIVEEETGRSDETMTYAYKILESPLPVANYQSTLSVAKAGDRSVVSWIGSYEAKGGDDAKAKGVIDAIYEAGLAEIAKKAQ